MEEWETVDVDYSDIPSPLLRPCLNKSSQSQSQSIPTPTTSLRLIPGPAGTVQAAMIRRKTRDNSQEDPSISTQEYVARAMENLVNDYRNDDDFKCISWLNALEFACISQNGMEEFVLPSTPLKSIKERLNQGKVDKVVAVIKSCTQNGLGDMMVTMKDPTGSIDGSIHWKVLTETEFAKDISVGSVLILEKVSIFAPSEATLYLNITRKNVVKAFCKEIGPPSSQTCPSPTVKYADCHEISLEEGRTKGITKELSRIPFTVGDDCRNACIITQNTAVGKESLCARKVAATEETAGMDIADDYQIAFDSNNKFPTEEIFSGSFQHSIVAANLVENHDAEEVQNIDKVQKQRQPLMSRASLPEWTDEQLNELFAGDCDDDDSLLW